MSNLTTGGLPFLEKLGSTLFQSHYCTHVQCCQKPIKPVIPKRSHIKETLRFHLRTRKSGSPARHWTACANAVFGLQPSKGHRRKPISNCVRR